MTTIHLGDCQTDCETCTNNYHSGFNNIDCDVCNQFIESAPLCNNCGQYETHANDYDCPAFNFELVTCPNCFEEVGCTCEAHHECEAN